MRSHDDNTDRSRRSNDWAGPGMQITRTCGRCGKAKLPKGGKVLKVRGWVCAECVRPAGQKGE